ncbi:hypothetical protein SAMN02990966_02062 [Rhodospirillales bacterium URHD0017]|nr:hypothetical protein SAMN02990966_02062 [Rhodospirillales bacterium URHD0017]
MSRIRVAILKVCLLLAIPAAAFWASVDLASSVMLGIAVVAAWFAGLACLPSLKVQNASLALLSISLAWGALEMLLRTSLMAGVIVGRDAADMQAGQGGTTDPPLFARDETVGVRLIPNRRSRQSLTKDGRPIYDAFYTTDANGFRTLPPGPAGETPVLMLGDSFNFGVGINDDQTLAFYLRDLSAGRLQPVNLAIPGLGIHQVLRQLEIGEPARSGHKKFALALLSIVDDHVSRANGRVSWLRHSPRYEVETGDRLVLRGTFEHPSKFVRNLLAGSRLVALAWNAISADSEGDRHRFVRILREIKSKLAAEYGAKLLVLYFSGQTWRGDLAGARDVMVPLLCRANVSFIDVSSLPQVSSGPIDHFYIAGDGHPTAQLNRLLASTIIAGMADPSRFAACPR